MNVSKIGHYNAVKQLCKELRDDPLHNFTK